FLTKFDVNFQRRRLLFVIKDLNTYYSRHRRDVSKLDGLKRSLYDLLEDITNSAKPDAIPASIKQALRTAFRSISHLDINDDTQENILRERLKDYIPGFKSALEGLADTLNLDRFKIDADQLIADQSNIDWKSDLARNLTISYVGFSFWDVTTFSILGSKELGESNKIKVNRISPKDISILREEGDELPLRGTAMAGFGAFFSRADRENDYLWGRINSAERLIEQLYSQAKLSSLSHKLDIIALKKRAFTTILDVEEEYLLKIPELFTELRNKIANL
ncbi:hypothetical protein MNBD_ALPHA03-1941, partial [hydrothermal vent metagenome]